MTAPGEHRVTLPGMSVMGPGEPRIDGDYDAGMAVSLGPIAWTVAWRRGTLPTPDDARARAEHIARMPGYLQHHASVASVGNGIHDGAPTRTFVLRGDDGFQAQGTFFACDGRAVMIAVVGDDDVTATATPMVASFACQPEPNHATAPAPVMLDVAKGWRRDANTPIWAVRNEAGVVVRASMIPAVVDFLEGFVTRRAVTLHETLRASPENTENRGIWRGVERTPDGHLFAIAIVALRCPDGRIAWVDAQADGTPVDAGLALAQTARCLGEGESPPAFPR